MQEPDRARIIEAGHWTRIMYALQRIKFVITHGLALRELRAHLRHKTEKPQEKRSFAGLVHIEGTSLVCLCLE